jgi:hypothetical protein
MPWGAVAGALVSGGASYLSSKEKAKGQTTSDPQFVVDASKDAIDRATEISKRPYTPYTGQRVASLSGNEREAYGKATSGAGQAELGKAGSLLDTMEDYSPSALEKFSNPYTEAVLTPQVRELNRTYDRERSALENSKAGSRGGDRSALMSSALERRHAESITDVTGRTYHDAFREANENFFRDSERKTRAAAAYQSLGGDMAKMNTQQIQDLMATGGVKRMLEQADLDFDLQQFTEARDWDTNNMKGLLDAIDTAKGTQRTTTGPQASPWGAALGAAATVAGAYFTGGGSLDPGWGSGKKGSEALDQMSRELPPITPIFPDRP